VGLGIEVRFGFVSVKYLSPSDALCLPTRFQLLQDLLWRLFSKKVDFDGHVLPLRTVSLFELTTNHIS